MYGMNLKVQPFIIVVGPSSSNIEKVYIQVDEITFEIDSFLEAVYTLFQVYLVANLSYPLESVNLSYFIQWGVFNIRTDSDEQIPLIHSTLHKINKK